MCPSALKSAGTHGCTDVCTEVRDRGGGGGARGGGHGGGMGGAGGTGGGHGGGGAGGAGGARGGGGCWGDGGGHRGGGVPGGGGGAGGGLKAVTGGWGRKAWRGVTRLGGPLGPDRPPPCPKMDMGGPGTRAAPAGARTRDAHSAGPLLRRAPPFHSERRARACARRGSTAWARGIGCVCELRRRPVQHSGRVKRGPPRGLPGAVPPAPRSGGWRGHCIGT